MLNYKILNFSKNLLILSSFIITLISFISCSDMMNNYSIKDILTNTVPPTYTSMMINNNDTYTYLRNATIQLNVTDAAQMQFSDDSGTTWTSWEPYSDSKSWKLKLGTSTKTVQGRFRKSDNSIISLSDDIVFCERLIASDGVTNKYDSNMHEGYGGMFSISSDGKIIATGQPWDTLGLGHYTGSVYIYTWNALTETWVESKINAADTNNCRSFGSGIALSSDGLTLAVSDYNNISGKSIYIFKWTGIAWNQIQKIIVPHIWYRLSLSGNGNTLVIGDPRDNTHLHPPLSFNFADGAIYIYEYNGGVYNGTKYTPPIGDLTNGVYVAISNDGNTAISIPAHNTGGVTMFIHRRNGLSWDTSMYYVGGGDELYTNTPKISSDGIKVLTGVSGYHVGDLTFIRYMTWNGSNWNHTPLNPSDEISTSFARNINSNNSCTKFIAGEYASGLNHFHLFNYDGALWTSIKYNTPDVYEISERFGTNSAMSDSGVFAVSTTFHTRADGEYIGEIFIYRE